SRQRRRAPSVATTRGTAPRGACPAGSAARRIARSASWPSWIRVEVSSIRITVERHPPILTTSMTPACGGREGPPMIELPGRKQDVDALVFSPDGQSLAVGGSASHVQLWDLARKKARPVLGPRGPHRAVGFLGERLYSVIAGGWILVVDLSTGKEV